MLPDEDEEGDVLTHLGRSLADEDFKLVQPCPHYACRLSRLPVMSTPATDLFSL